MLRARALQEARARRENWTGFSVFLVGALGFLIFSATQLSGWSGPVGVNERLAYAPACVALAGAAQRLVAIAADL